MTEPCTRSSDVVHRRRIDVADPPRPVDLLHQFDDARRPVLLEGPAGAPSRHAWLCFDPVRVLDGARDVLDLRAALAELELVGESPRGPFLGGFVGTLAYDLGVHGEACALPRDPWGWPAILGGLYTDLVHWDMATGTAELVLRTSGDARRDAERSDAVLAAVERARRADPRRSDGGDGADAGDDPRTVGAPLVRRTAAERFRANVECARDRIAEGDYYQANLSHRFTTSVARSPVALYAALARANPAPYMGYLVHPDGAILSSSPELLFEFDGRVARSRPIKGTCARAADPSADAEAARALLASAKDRAELAMIVDLVRNDLGRVARPGGVRVPEFVGLETFEHVHHLVGTIEAEVRADVDAIDLLAALFPGGSITGAPKFAAMSAIAALEGEGRGPFTGSLGWIGTDGAACFNILIRTLLTRPNGGGTNEVSFRVGGGITWRSDPAAEDEETLTKAIGLARALDLDLGVDPEGDPERDPEGGAVVRPDEAASAAPGPLRRVAPRSGGGAHDGA